MNAHDRDPIRLTPASTYAQFAPYVRRHLARFGVRDADLPDLCHEVFLVVHGKRQQLPAVGRDRPVAARDLSARRRGLPAPGRAPAGGAGVRRRRTPRCRRRRRRRARRRGQALPAAPGAEPPRRRVARSARPARRRRDAAQRARQAGRARSQDGPQPAGARAPPGVALAVRAVQAGLRSGAAPRITPPSSPFMRDQAERGRRRRLRGERARDSARLARALQRRARKRHRLRLARPADCGGDRSRR